MVTSFTWNQRSARNGKMSWQWSWSSWSSLSWSSWHTPKIPTERIPIGIRSVGKYSGHHHHHHCHHCSVPLSLFMKWPRPNQLVLFSYTNWLEPSAYAEYADHKSEFSKMAKVGHIQPDAKKNYNCNQCGYSSTKLSYLKTHMWVHSGGKPFVCSQCNYSCNQAGRLGIHMPIQRKAL